MDLTSSMMEDLYMAHLSAVMTLPGEHHSFRPLLQDSRNC